MNIQTIRNLSTTTDISKIINIDNDKYDYLLLLLAFVLFMRNSEYLDYYLQTFLFISPDKRNINSIEVFIKKNFTKLPNQYKEKIEELTGTLSIDRNNIEKIIDIMKSSDYIPRRFLTVLLYIIHMDTYTKRDFKDYITITTKEKSLKTLRKILLEIQYKQLHRSGTAVYTTYINIIPVIYYKCYLFRFLAELDEIKLNNELKKKIFSSIFFDLNELIKGLSQFEQIEFYLKNYKFFNIYKLEEKIEDLFDCIWIFFKNKTFNISENTTLEIFRIKFTGIFSVTKSTSLPKLIKLLLFILEQFYYNMFYRYKDNELLDYNKTELNFVKYVFTTVLNIIKDTNYIKSKYESNFMKIDKQKQKLDWLYFYAIDVIYNLDLTDDDKKDFILRYLREYSRYLPTSQQRLYLRSLIDSNDDNEILFLFIQLVNKDYIEDKDRDLLIGLIYNLANNYNKLITLISSSSSSSESSTTTSLSSTIYSEHSSLRSSTRTSDISSVYSHNST